MDNVDRMEGSAEVSLLEQTAGLTWRQWLHRDRGEADGTKRLLGGVLDVDDSVEGAPPLAQPQVRFALNVHENYAPHEADGHHNQFGPKGPVEHALAHLLSGAVDQYVQRPNDAG